MSGYSGKLKDGRAVFVPHWPASVSLENLAKAGQYLGADNLITISDKNKAAVVVAIMQAKEPEHAIGIIKHFTCQARIDGDKLDPADFDKLFSGSLDTVTELFSIVVHAQYHDFFESGLEKEPSPPE